MSKDRYKLSLTDFKTPDSAYDAIVFAYACPKAGKDWKPFLPLGSPEQAEVLKLIQRREIKIESGAVVSFDRSAAQRLNVVLIDSTLSTFKLLTLSKDIIRGCKDLKAQSLCLKLGRLPAPLAKAVVDTFVSAIKAAEFVPPNYSDKPKPGWAPKLNIQIDDKTLVKSLSEQMNQSMAEGDANNLVRELAMMAGNDLTPMNYVARIKSESSKEGLAFEFFDVKKLQKMKAGAFLAVVQASDSRDAGIVKLSYKPAKKSSKHICLVGKGITFDTGGTNLKSAPHMYNMHKDMAGSAVSYSLIRLAAREKWPFAVTAFLAIADNLTGAKAYRQNDVVTAMNGKSIEIVHTDAEGRMVLADTLYLASKEEPNLILDFATLTGACVAAIGSTYSGAFTNRSEYHAAIIESGKASGERVWPFPLDDDFGDCLKSDTADIKQCRLTGGVDHIEAAIFLKSFLATDVPWVHIDLAAADHAGGLAHVDTEATGFGVRFASTLIRHLI
ncbi:MAG: leucyl aminopeptidase family protein [Oligoflexus sp.]|nr:leucyl aminopeptidase family protein [Oligoflexus sp.]